MVVIVIAIVIAIVIEFDEVDVVEVDDEVVEEETWEELIVGWVANKNANQSSFEEETGKEIGKQVHSLSLSQKLNDSEFLLHGRNDNLEFPG